MANQSISTLNVKLTADGRALLSEFQKSQQAIKTWAGQVQNLKTSFGSLVSADLFANTIRSLTGELKQFVGESLKAAADLEVYNLQFETIFQSAEKAKKVIQEIYDFGDKTPFQANDLIAAAKQLAGYQIAAENILPTLKTLGDIAAVSGASLGDLSQIYGRIVSDGRALNEDLNRLADRSIPIYNELSKVIGVSTSEVRKLASEGKITSEQVQQALVNMTTGAGQFSGAIEKLAGTSAGQWSTMLDSLEAIKRSFGEGLLPEAKNFSAILTEIISGGNQAADAMETWRAAGEKLGQTLRIIAGLVQTIRAHLILLEGSVASLIDMSARLSGYGLVDRLTGSNITGFTGAFVDNLKKQYDDLNASAVRMWQLGTPLTPPSASGGTKQAGIESIVQPTRTPAQIVQDLSAASDAAAKLGTDAKRFIETLAGQVDGAKTNISQLFKGAGGDGATSSAPPKASPIDAAKMINEDIRAAVDKARAELAQIDGYLRSNEPPSPQRNAERAGVINFGNFRAGKYGDTSSSEYFRIRDDATKSIIESLLGNQSKATDETAKNVEKMENRLAGEMAKDRGLLTRIASALEKKSSGPIQVKVYGV